MQQQQQPRSKKAMKKELSKKEIKQMRKLAKGNQKQQLAAHYAMVEQ